MVGIPCCGTLDAYKNASVTNSYWDKQSSGYATSGGGTGLTTAQLQSGSLPFGFDPTVLRATPGLYPSLQWKLSSIPFPTAPTSAPDVRSLPASENLFTALPGFVTHLPAGLSADSVAFFGAVAGSTPQLASKAGDFKAQAHFMSVAIEGAADTYGIVSDLQTIEASRLARLALAELDLGTIAVGNNLPTGQSFAIDLATGIITIGG